MDRRRGAIISYIARSSNHVPARHEAMSLVSSLRSCLCSSKSVLSELIEKCVERYISETDFILTFSPWLWRRPLTFG